MRRLNGALLCSGVLVFLGGCAQPAKPPLYLWEAFPRQQYDTLSQADSNADEQIRALQAHVEKARATNSALPPGLRAHLGMLLLGVGKIDEARELWEAEKLAFPESTSYMDQLLKRLGAPRKTETPV